MNVNEARMHVVLHYGSWRGWGKGSPLEHFFEAKPVASDKEAKDVFYLPAGTVVFVKDSAREDARTLDTIKGSKRTLLGFLEVSGAIMHGATATNQMLYVGRATKRTGIQIRRERTSGNQRAESKSGTLPTAAIKVTGKNNYVMSLQEPADFTIVHALPLATSNYSEGFPLPPGLFSGFDADGNLQFLVYEMQRDGIIRNTAHAMAKAVNKQAKRAVKNKGPRAEVDALVSAAKHTRSSFRLWVELDLLHKSLPLKPRPGIQGADNFGKWSGTMLPGDSFAGLHALVLQLAADGCRRAAGLLAWSASTGPHPSRRFYLLNAPNIHTASQAPADGRGAIVFAKHSDESKRVTRTSAAWDHGAFLVVDWLYPDFAMNQRVMRIVACASWADNPRDLSYCDMAARSFAQMLVQRTLIHADRVEVQREHCICNLTTAAFSGNDSASGSDLLLPPPPPLQHRVSLATLLAHLTLDRHIVRSRPATNQPRPAAVGHMTEAIFAMERNAHAHGQIDGPVDKPAQVENGARPEDDFSRYVDAEPDMLIEDEDFSKRGQGKKARALEDAESSGREKRARLERQTKREAPQALNEDELRRRAQVLWGGGAVTESQQYRSTDSPATVLFTRR